MTTNELIERLKREDPEGTAEVIVHGNPIYALERLPGYYDGSFGRLIQDPKKAPWYNIVGFCETRAGTKLRLCTMSMEDVIDEDPEAIIELDPSLGEHRLSIMVPEVEKMRQASRDMHAEVEEWARQRKEKENESNGKS